MPHDRSDWLRRIKAVEREHTAAHLAIDRLVAAVSKDPALLQGALTLRDIRHAAERLDGTYLIRLFAEFETALRLFWPTARGSDPPSRMRDLLDGVAATRRIPHDQLMNAHAAREFRNNMVHEQEEPATPISIAKARSHLCQFLSFLPLKW